MKNIQKIQYLLLVIFPGIVLAQTSTEDNVEMEGYSFLDYWPVLLLPIFGIVFYRLWWRKKHSK